ncbi:reverse transcriptase Ty1/copia-type domain-containing protein [Citrus sinensis]|uniref:Reverse transcriptase Ty1/copia-type domain-containing protein n=1 Tax=Citrus sinensis TaxID=2711 RepID=A0ACB8M3C5_CITSI|nr:reverse transcriptase Ty1/copia-type domain-containing protein [Citrus sinensis]
MIASHDGDEPRTYSEAITSSAKELWIKAIDEEMKSMRSNHVWDLVDLPAYRKAIGNKWVLRVKRKAYDIIERYKACLLAKGYNQQEGIDYEETFSLVVMFTSIRLILAIVAHMDLELHQMDVKTTFLNGELEEEIYMEQPDGYIINDQERKVCKLKKSIYGLKQSSKQWYLRFLNL